MLKSTVILGAIILVVQAQLDMDSDKMNFEDNIAQESQSDEQRIFANAITAKPLLNDGKPFYVARDPATGTLDFNMKKTVGISNDIPVSQKDEKNSGGKSGNDINSLGHNNFHDYLNLPVKYSSSKFVYPLISGSYANLKYQGNNKNHISNHKNYSTTSATTTQSPKYFTHITNSDKKFYTATFNHPESSSTKIIRTTTTREATKPTKPQTTTSKKAFTTSTATTIVEVPTTPSTTVKYSSTIIQNSFPSTFKNKYVDSSETRKKTTMATTTTKIPNTPASNPVKFLDDLLETVGMKETKPTTYRPPFDATRFSFSTSMPLLKPSAFKPMPTESPSKNSSQKITFENGSNDPSAMSLSEIINSISGNDQISNDKNAVHYADKKPAATSFPSKKVTQEQKPLNQHKKTLQQQIQNGQQQQFIELPVHQPLQFPQQPQSNDLGNNVVSSNSQYDDYVEFSNPNDQFVKYEVQKPNVNLVKFQQAPSMNNVVISPGQNSASFVLGSQQNMGSVGIGSSMGVGTSNHDYSNGPMKAGQVINEDPPLRTSSNQQNINQIQQTIRFPSEAENSYVNAPIVKGTIKTEGIVENVQPPQALSQNIPSSQNQLVFPSSGEKLSQNEIKFGNPSQAVHSNPSQVIFENVNDIYEKINDKKQKQEIPTSELSNNIPIDDSIPSRVLTPPSPMHQHPFIQHQQPPQFNNMRRPGPGQYRPGLPNILPQFRPNAKASQGHPQIYKDVGAIRIPYQGQNPNNRNYPPQVPQHKVGLANHPSMMHHQHPNNQNYRRLPPHHHHHNRINKIHHNHPHFHPNIETANRRVFRLPPPPPPPMNDRNFNKPPALTPPGFQLKRPSNGAPETMQMQQRPLNPPVFVDSELNKSSPPQPVQHFVQKEIMNENDPNNTNLEPVITLQMLQNKKSGSKLNLPPVPHDIPQDLQSSFPNNHKQDISKNPSIYVVYPVSSNSNEQSLINSNSDSALIGEPHSSGLPEYQNTPFSVVSHFEQEPLLMKKDKKKNQFPYHLERPATNEYINRPHYLPQHDGSIYNTGEEPTSSRVVNKRPPFLSENPDSAISSTLTRVTEKPIAIAYTPTEPNRHFPTVTNFYHNLHPHHHYQNPYEPHLGNDKFSLPDYGGPVISEILDEKHIGYDFYHRQQELQHHLNNGEDLEFYKEHYDFQAPFHASVSLNPEVTNPYEGWSIVTQSTDTNKIDRVDLHVSESSEESTTKQFDPNEFQPVFESGFKPIYSSAKVSLAPELLLDSSEYPSTLGITYSTQPITTTKTTTTTTTPQPPTTSSTSSSMEVSTEIEPKSNYETTTKKVEKKKVEIDSLEAFFDSLTRDYDDDDESTNKSENENRSQ